MGYASPGAVLLPLQTLGQVTIPPAKAWRVATVPGLLPKGRERPGYLRRKRHGHGNYEGPCPGRAFQQSARVDGGHQHHAGKHNVWVRTQANAPAQKPWFSETSGEGSGQLATGRVAVNQMKTAPYMWRWNEYSGYLQQISEIASKADVSPIEFADRQSILLLNPGLNGRLQVTNTIRCAISIYNPGDVFGYLLCLFVRNKKVLKFSGGAMTVDGDPLIFNEACQVFGTLLLLC